MSGWTDFQVKTHMRRLVEMAYLLVHCGGPGKSFVYELMYCGEGGRLFLMRLVDVAREELLSSWMAGLGARS